MPQESRIDLSIIIPIYNEAKFINRLFDDLKKYFNTKSVEVIFVDDGSNDDTPKLIKEYEKKDSYKFNFIPIKLDINSGKGKAIQTGIKKSLGKYILLQDADLELDTKDASEMYQMIKNNNEIKCIFGSRYLSGKLKKNNYFFNNLVGKINSLIFNIFFSQSISDVHCGLKILHRSVIEKINLTVNDFGIEIDIASQIVRNNFFIYEFGVSYYFRTKSQGKKITWIDGIKSFYYLIKARFFDNPTSTNISILFSSLYMAYVGSYFGMGLGKTLFIIIFFMLGLIIGLRYKILPSAFIFFFIYIGSLLGSGQGKVLAVLLFFILGLYFAKKINKFKFF